MRLITPPLDVTIETGFSKDILGRDKFGEALANIIQEAKEELVITIDGKWGEGKTTFLKMWQGLLKERGVHTIYIDSFANDYTNDPFICVASAIQEYAEQNIAEDRVEKLKQLKEGLRSAGVKLLGWSLKLGAKAATIGILKEADIEELNRIGDELSQGATSFIEKNIEEKLNARKAEIEILQRIRQLLSELPSQLKENVGHPLVVIIDELDRCRPAFAIELLEKCKHIFSVPNVVFVLAINKEQLEESVKLVYGKGIDAQSYLQKFVTIDARLPKNTHSEHSSDYHKYVQHLYDAHGLSENTRNTFSQEEILALSLHFGLTLRQLERMFTLMTLHLMTIKNPTDYERPIIATLCAIKVANPRMFRRLLNKEYTFGSFLLDFGPLPTSSRSEARYRLEHLLEYFRFLLLSPQDFNALPDTDPIKGLTRSFYIWGVDRENLLPILGRRIECFNV